MEQEQTRSLHPSPASLSGADRWLILATAFLGWLCAGFLLNTTSLAMRDAALDLLDRAGTIELGRMRELLRDEKNLAPEDEARLRAWTSAEQSWFAFFQCSLLFGAATGGLLFGRLGDRIGRARAMGAAILCYSLFSAACWFVQVPWQLLILWFLACTGVGGMWPNGVALVAETWSDLSRPLVAGLLGTSANIGIFALASVGTWVRVTPDHWRWLMLVCAAPVVLGLFVLAFVRESPRWLASRGRSDAPTPATPVTEVFRPPLAWVTAIGITLATVPLFGAWGSANWMVPWAGGAGDRADPPDPYLKARVSQARALPGIIGSALGGWIAHQLGRRRAYAMTSLVALVCAQYTFWMLVPTDRWFLGWVAALGFWSGVYFGWLPLCLPELFPTRARATGAGVCFNFGRVLTAFNVFATGALMLWFRGDYARIGRVTSLVFVVGLVAVWLAPDTGKRELED